MASLRRFYLPTLLSLAALLPCPAAYAQYWPARRMLAAVQTPMIVGKKDGVEVARFQRAWVERAVTVLDRMAPEYGIATPELFVNKASAGPNAFVTIADGKTPIMAINTDMLRMVGDSDDMMAAVIGHELGHLKAQHLTRGAESAAAVNLIGLLLGAAVDVSQAKKGRDTQGLGTAIGGVGAGLITAKFSRDQEREADELGIKAMARAGYDPSSVPMLWRRMSALGPSSGLWMDSHPSAGEREIAMSALASSLQSTYAANRLAPSNNPAGDDPYPQSRYANFDPLTDDVVTQNAYQKGRTAYQAKRFSDAVPFLTEAAENGDERAMTLMAGILQGGLDGRPADSNRSYSYLKAAAEKGFGPAIGSLGSITLTGKGVPKDLAEARKLLLLADKRNYPRATALLGMMYIDGNGVTKDPILARRYAEKAAQGGDALGRALFGALLRDGLGGSAEPDRGFQLLVQTAPSLPWASYQLGIAYERGVGTAMDRDKAISAYQAAANGGVAAATNKLNALARK